MLYCSFLKTTKTTTLVEVVEVVAAVGVEVVGVPPPELKTSMRKALGACLFHLSDKSSHEYLRPSLQ